MAKVLVSGPLPGPDIDRLRAAHDVEIGPEPRGLGRSGLLARLSDHDAIIPFVTEVAESAHTRGPKPAMIFGGKALGMQGGQFQNFSSTRPQQDLFVTIAQAYFGNTTPLTTNLSAEKFVKTGVSVIPGLWTKPA